jgi:hypothetical protein
VAELVGHGQPMAGAMAPLENLQITEASETEMLIRVVSNLLHPRREHRLVTVQTGPKGQSGG